MKVFKWHWPWGVGTTRRAWCWWRSWERCRVSSAAWRRCSLRNLRRLCRHQTRYCCPARHLQTQRKCNGLCYVNRRANCPNTVQTENVFERPFVKRFVLLLRYRTVFCPVCRPVTLVYCGQTAGWSKMPLGTEVGLGPGHIVLHWDPAPPERDTAAPPTLFNPCLLWPKGRPCISATAELMLVNAWDRQRCNHTLGDSAQGSSRSTDHPQQKSVGQTFWVGSAVRRKQLQYRKQISKRQQKLVSPLLTHSAFKVFTEKRECLTRPRLQSMNVQDGPLNSIFFNTSR